MIWQDGQTCRVDSRPFCAEEVLSVPSAEAPMGLRGPAAAISGLYFLALTCNDMSPGNQKRDRQLSIGYK